MKIPLLVLPLLALAPTILPGQTEFNATPGVDLLDAANWSNGLPAPGNDGTIEVDGSLASDANIVGWGHVTIGAGATVNRTDGKNVSLEDTALVIRVGSLTTSPGTGDGKSTLFLRASSSLVMEDKSGVVTSQSNIAVHAGGTLTMNDGSLMIEGQKLNTDGVVNLVGGEATISSLLDGGDSAGTGSPGVVNLTNTRITVPEPAQDGATLTVFRTTDPWTFNFISGGSGSITIIGRDDTAAIEALITGGGFFTIDGVPDAALDSYSLTYDGSNTVLRLRSGPQVPPIRITATEFEASTRTFSFTWESMANATYTVWESPDLAPGSWSVIDNAVAGQEPTTTYPIPGLPLGQGFRFYRVSLNP